MKIKLPIYMQLLALLVLHLAFVLVILLAIFGSHFAFAWDAIFASPVGDRVEQTAWLLQKEVVSHSPKEWDAILQNFGKHYGVKFYLFDFLGNELAGQTVNLPSDVYATVVPKFHRGPPPPWMFAPPQSLPPQQDRFGVSPPADREGARSPSLAPSDRDGFEFPLPPPPMSANGLGFAHNSDPQSPQATLGAPWAVTHNANSFPANGLPGKSVMVGHGFAGFPNRFLLHTANPDRFWLIVRIPLINPQMKTIVPGAVIACTNNLWQTNLLFDLRPALLIVTAILAFSIVFWLPFAYRLSRELSNLNKATQRIAEGRFDTRVKANNLDEFGSLGQSVNGMAERLNAFVSQEKRFLGDIAHELGSPIARLQVALELLQTAAPDSRERIVTDIQEDVDEMAALVNELLDFSKAGLSGKTTELTTVDIRSLLTQIVEKMGAQKLIRLDLMKTKTVLGDETLLARAFANILRNAVTYAADYGLIHVRSDVDGEQLIVVVADSGPGVPSDTVLQLTQPFFRPESSRTRTTGGAGLGLAIVQSCVHACQGELAIRNRVPTGLEVEVRLCLASA